MTTIGIISIGEMGLGIGKLLKAHGFRVVTNASDRRQASNIAHSTISRRNAAGDIEIYS
jgi:predicted dinucleotide-binding enzyme